MNISEDKKRAIWAAADELQAMSIDVTMKAIKEHMGGGSFSYISPVLREWKEAQRPKFTIGSELPEELLPIVEQALNQVASVFWDTTSRMGDDRIDQAQADANARLEAANKQLQEFEIQCSELEAERDRLAHDHEHLQQQSNDQLEEIKHKGSQIEQLQQELEQTKAKLTETDNALKDKEREYKSLSQDHERVSLQATDHKTQLEKQQKELTRTLDQAASQQETIKQCQETVIAKDADIAELNKKITDQAKAQNNLSQQLKKKETTIAGLEVRVDDRNMEISQLQSSNKKQQDRLEKLIKVEADFTTAQVRIKKLNQESDQARQENKGLIKEVSRLETSLELLEKDFSIAQENIQKLNKETDHVKQENNNLNKEVKRLESKIKAKNK